MVALQGARWKSTGTFACHGWTINAAEAVGPTDGVLVAVRRPNGTVRATTRLPGRILETRRCHKNAPIVLLSCYAPGTHHPLAEIHQFWGHLDNAVATVARRRRLVVAGDFNAHVGDGRPNQWVGEVGAASWNVNGNHLYDLATQRRLRVLNTFGTSAACEWTWLKPGSTKGA